MCICALLFFNRMKISTNFKILDISNQTKLHSADSMFMSILFQEFLRQTFFFSKV